jgi:hypothetical protein
VMDGEERRNPRPRGGRNPGVENSNVQSAVFLSRIKSYR